MKTAMRAQSVSEYVICVLTIVLAAMAIQTYVKRGLQGRYLDLVTYTTAKVTESSGSGKTQYEPYYLNEDFTTAKNTSIQENNQRRGWRRNDILQDDTTRSGTSVEGINCYDDK